MAASSSPEFSPSPDRDKEGYVPKYMQGQIADAVSDSKTPEAIVRSLEKLYQEHGGAALGVPYAPTKRVNITENQAFEYAVTQARKSKSLRGVAPGVLDQLSLTWTKGLIDPGLWNGAVKGAYEDRRNGSYFRKAVQLYWKKWSLVAILTDPKRWTVV